MKTIKRNTGLISSLAIAGLMLAYCGVGLAETKVNETGQAAADGLVVVENIAGSIEVIGWDKKEVKVTGTLSDEIEKLEFKASGKKTTIIVKYPRNIRNISEGADLVIHVPRQSRLDIESISCSIDMQKVAGTVTVESISGEVTLDGNCEEVEISSISGAITIDGEHQEIEVEAISGAILVQGKQSNVSASSISGEINLTFEVFTDLEVESVASTIWIKGTLAKGGQMELESVSGDINLIVPHDISAEFIIETFSGSISDAFGHEASKVSKYAPGRELEFVTGGGDGRVEISTFSGDVKIKN